MNEKGFLTGAVVALASVITFAQDVTYDYDRTANLSRFRTYSWAPGTPLSDPLNHARVISAIEREMAAKGLVKPESGAPGRPRPYEARPVAVTPRFLTIAAARDRAEARARGVPHHGSRVRNAAEPLSDRYLTGILGRDDFWALAASIEGRTVGGLTARALPLTRAEVSEVFLYDLALDSAYQRRGVGRQLVTTLRSLATAAGVSVRPRRQRGFACARLLSCQGRNWAPVTIFTFSDDLG